MRRSASSGPARQTCGPRPAEAPPGGGATCQPQARLLPNPTANCSRRADDGRAEERAAPRRDREGACDGDAAELVELLRGSGLPGPRPNLELARAVGGDSPSARVGADRLLAELARAEHEYLRVVAAHALAARSLAPRAADRRRASALADLQQIAEDPRHVVRLGVIDALRVRLDALGEPAVHELAAWTDGYLQAHVALEALSDRALLTTLPSADPVVARLDEAFVLADASPRAAERTQGMRALRRGMPAQIAAFAARFPEALAWLEGKTTSARPETREVVAGAIAAVRRAVISDAEAARLSALLEASAKPRRDAARVVHGTRKRSRGRG